MQGLVPFQVAYQKAKQDTSDGESVKVLDVASGTGRFLSFLLQAYPDADATALDLSKYYLEKAKEQCELHTAAGGKLTTVEAKAEEMPFEDESFDIITNVYLFHELPLEVRKEVAR